MIAEQRPPNTTGRKYSLPPAPTRRYQAGFFTILLCAYLLGVLALTVVQMVSGQTDGLIALSEVFALFLFAPLVLLVFPALRQGAWLARAALLVSMVVFALRFDALPPLAQPQEHAEAFHLNALAWNVLDGGDYQRIRNLLLEKSADVVSLEEASTSWLDQDAEIDQLYPYRVKSADAPAGGAIVVLSKYPVAEQGILGSGYPQGQYVRLALPGGRMMTVVGVHTERPAIGKGGWCTSKIYCYVTTNRDELLSELDQFVTRAEQRGDAVLLLGDFNLTDREPAYKDIASRLQDAQRSVSSGLTGTWRPSKIDWLQAGILRIDYMFASPNVTPLRFNVDCTRGWSDHCVIQGRFELQ